MGLEEKPSEINESQTYTLPLTELMRLLKTDLNRGLSKEEAEKRKRIFGLNAIPKLKPSLFKIYGAPLFNWLINIYLIISAILAIVAFFILKEIWLQVTQWLSVISINAALAIIQQSRAQSKLEALQRLSAPKSKVIRDGKIVEIASDRIVPGDIIKLVQGDRIPADARIITASSLRVNEATLTGESEEVGKFERDEVVEENALVSNRRNMVFLGTYVTAGSARAMVVKIGRETQLGKISKNLKQLNIGEIPLRQKINEIAKYLGITVLTFLSLSLTYNLVLLYFNNELFVGGVLNLQLVAKVIVKSLTTAISVMPINIPLLTTVILLTGVLAMAKRRVVIRDLNAVERLGRVSVVCSDKTGTITKNEMTVKWVCIPTFNSPDLLYGVTGVGFQPQGRIMKYDSTLLIEDIVGKNPEAFEGKEVTITPESILEYILFSGLLNNEGVLVEEKVKTADKKRDETVYRTVGDATDAAILLLFHKSKLDENIYRSRFQEVLSYPFDSKLKRMTKISKDNDNGKYVVFTKGATEVLLPRCSYYVTGSIKNVETLREEYITSIANIVDLFASAGYRVISFAFKYIDKLPSKPERDFLENNLIYLGFVAIIDPPRDGVLESVLETEVAGIFPAMITGDSVKTARRIATQVGIADESELAVEGLEIESLSDKEFLNTSVFARVSPEHKMLIVERYKKQNRVVAMTGDGVNDALAISMADVGISMGITGTEVAKQAADVIITDDSFNSIVAGIREGRGLFQKIRMIVFFYIAVNLAEALIFFVTSLIPNFYLLNTWQQIYIFMTAHSIPPFALIFDKLRKDVMKEKPRDTEGIFDKELLISMLLFCLSLSIMFYISYFGVLNGVIPVFNENKVGYIPDFNSDDVSNPANWAQAKARTMFHTVAFIAEISLIFSIRRINKSVFKTLRDDNYWFVWFLLSLVPLAHLILMYVPITQLVLMVSVGINLEVIHLTGIDWTIAITLGLVPIAILESFKLWLRKRGISI